MAFNQLKERMREHQAEMKRRAEQRKDAMELRRNKRLQVDLEPVLAASPSSTSAAPSIQWDEYKDSLQRFYDDRQTFLDKDDDDAHSEVPEEFRKHQSKNTDVSELPEEFFQTADSKFDVVDYVLEALPEHLDNDRLILYITSQMEKNDLFRDRVCQDLTAVVLEKYDTFVAGMQTVRDIDMDLSTADMYATNSRRLLAGFKESLITSTLRVVQRQRLRQRAVLIHEMVTVLERAQSLRSTMQTAIKDRRFADAVSAYTRAYTELQGKKSQRLSAINDIRASLPKYVAMLQDELDAELRELCFEGFDATKYAAVLRAYLLLDEHSQSQLEAQVAECVEEPKPMTVLIKCPDRMGPGDKVTVRTPNGRKFRVTIPPGTEAGKQFRVTMPLSESDRDVMSIKCPNGARPGQKLMVTTTKGQRVQAVVPEGCSPGIKFFIRIPKAVQAVQGVGAALEDHFVAAAQQQIHPVVMEAVRMKWRELRAQSRAQLRADQSKKKMEEKRARAEARAARRRERAERKRVKMEQRRAKLQAEEEARAKAEQPKINPYLAAATSSTTTQARPRGNSANPFAADGDDSEPDASTLPTNPFDAFGGDSDVSDSMKESSNPFGDDDDDRATGLDNPDAAPIANPFGDEFEHAPLKRTLSSNPFDDEDAEGSDNIENAQSPGNPFEDASEAPTTDANPFATDEEGDADLDEDSESDDLVDELVESEGTSDSDSDNEDADGDGLSSQTLRELVSMLHPTALAGALAAICAEMWKLLHTHYLFLQWHRDPFGDQNTDIAYLHRCTDDEDITPSHDFSKLVSRLDSARQSLWKECQQSISQFIECVPIHQKEFNTLPRMAEVAAVCGTFVTIGKSVLVHGAHRGHGADDKPAGVVATLGVLEITMRNKLGTFFRKHIHETSFRTLKDGLQREEWNLLPIDVEAMGGLETIMLQRLAVAIQGPISSRWQQLHVLFEHSLWDRGSRQYRDLALDPDTVLDNFPQAGVPFARDGSFQVDGKALAFAKRMLGLQLGVPRPPEGSVGDFSDEYVNAGSYFKQNGGESASRKGAGLPPSNGTVTSSGLNLFAQFAGKYFHCMRLLPQIAGDVFGHLVELFDYYMYSVFVTFFLDECHDYIWDHDKQISEPEFSELIGHLRHLATKYDSATIKANLKPTNELLNLIDGLKVKDEKSGMGLKGIGTNPSSPANAASSPAARSPATYRVKRKDQRVPSVARLPFNPKLSVEASMWGINARSVAVESVLFLSEVMWFLEPRLACFMDADQCASSSYDATAGDRMREFYKTFPVIVSQFRQFFYRRMAETMCMVGRDRTPIRGLVEKNNWTSSSDMLECHQYVKKILQQMEGLWIRLDALSSSMPPMVAEEMWAHCYEQVLLEVMEGFASVKKCNPAGRGMMKMDLTAIVRGVAKIHPVKPLSQSGADGRSSIRCSQEKIDAYLNAFYFDSRSDLIEWIQENKSSYYEHWMIGLALVGVGAKMKPHEKEKLKKEVSAFYEY